MASTNENPAFSLSPDSVLADIADYVIGFKAEGTEAHESARYCLMDSLG